MSSVKDRLPACCATLCDHVTSIISAIGSLRVHLLLQSTGRCKVLRSRTDLQTRVASSPAAQPRKSSRRPLTPFRPACAAGEPSTTEAGTVGTATGSHGDAKATAMKAKKGLGLRHRVSSQAACFLSGCCLSPVNQYMAAYSCTFCWSLCAGELLWVALFYLYTLAPQHEQLWSASRHFGTRSEAVVDMSLRIVETALPERAKARHF